MITHRVDEAEKVSDRIIIMNNGSFLEQGPPDELKETYGIVYLFRLELNSTQDDDAINEEITRFLPFCERIYDDQNQLETRMTRIGYPVVSTTSMERRDGEGSGYLLYRFNNIADYIAEPS
jgi:ABC-type multidrug transport system ATPase subunit